VQAFVKPWHHCPFSHTFFAGPQAHFALACCSVWQVGRAFDLAPFASAKPADMVVASKAIAKILSIVSSSLG
jgi:hypothetical protein